MANSYGWFNEENVFQRIKKWEAGRKRCIDRIKEMARKMECQTKDAHDVKTVGTFGSVVGGSLSLGAMFAPMTAGISLPAFATFGTILSVVGTATNLIGDYDSKQKDEDIQNSYDWELKVDHRESEKIYALCSELQTMHEKFKMTFSNWIEEINFEDTESEDKDVDKSSTIEFNLSCYTTVGILGTIPDKSKSTEKMLNDLKGYTKSAKQAIETAEKVLTTSKPVVETIEISKITKDLTQTTNTIMQTVEVSKIAKDVTQTTKKTVEVVETSKKNITSSRNDKNS